MTLSNTVGVLYSGGLDSAALIARLADKGFTVQPVFIACGLRWEKQEKYWARRFLKAIRRRNIKPLLEMEISLGSAYRGNWSQTGRIPGAHSSDNAVFLPARNLLLINRALLCLSPRNIHRVAIATLKGNPFPDGKKSYFRALENLLSKSYRKSVKILVPFRDKSKKEILGLAKKYPIHLSFSCINPRGHTHCGKCNKCAERKKAFLEAGIKDLTTYA